MPQKHPPAITTLSCPGALDSASSTAGLGSAIAFSLAATLPRIRQPAIASIMIPARLTRKTRCDIGLLPARPLRCVYLIRVDLPHKVTGHPKPPAIRYRIMGVEMSTQEVKSSDLAKPDANEPEPQQRSVSRLLLTWGSLALAAAESLCVAAVGLSGVRVALGFTSLLAAGASGPATGWHREALRIPLLTIGALGALLSLLLLWNEAKLRRNPAAAWRIRPMTPKQRRRRTLQLVLAILTLLLVAAELITHPWFHHEL